MVSRLKKAALLAIWTAIVAPGFGEAREDPAAEAENAMPANDDALLKELEGSANGFMVAWRKHDIAALADNFTEDFVFAGERGVKDRAATLKGLEHCDLAAFGLSDFQMRKISAQAVVLIYKVHHDMVCGGHKVSDETLNTDLFVHRSVWKIAVTTETPLKP